MSSAAIEALCSSLDIRIVPTAARRGPRETHAGNVLRRLIEEHGAGHVTMVIRTIVESEGNETELRAETIYAVSDLILTRPEWPERGLEWIEAFDAIPLRELRQRAKDMRLGGARGALAVLLYERLERILSEPPRSCTKRMTAGHDLTAITDSSDRAPA